MDPYDCYLLQWTNPQQFQPNSSTDTDSRQENQAKPRAKVVSMWSVERETKPKRFSSARVVIFLGKKERRCLKPVRLSLSLWANTEGEPLVPPCVLTLWFLLVPDPRQIQLPQWTRQNSGSSQGFGLLAFSQDHTTKLLVESSATLRLPNRKQYRQESCVEYPIEQDTRTISHDRKLSTFAKDQDTWKSIKTGKLR